MSESIAVESPPNIEPLTQARSKPKITVSSDRLKRLQKIHAGAMVMIPFLGSIAAFAFAFWFGISWIDIGLLVSLYVLTLTGITVGYHRLFSHCAFQAHPSVRVALAILGSMAFQGPLIYWASNHRRHHQYSDRGEDPHSPYCAGDRPLGHLHGLWHAQVGWMFSHEITNTFLFAKDLIQDAPIAKVNQLYYPLLFLGLAISPIAGGLLSGSWMGALSGFLWGNCVRVMLTYHFTNAINSISHLYGTRPFKTREQSTNNLWIAIPTLGESWHNNHHAFPHSAIFGLKWWQIDFGGWVVRFLEALGLVWAVKHPSADAIAAKTKSIHQIES